MALPTIQVKPLPLGTPDWEAKRAAVLRDSFAHVPPGYRLPAQLLASPPKNVSDIPRTCGILTPRELEITDAHDATSLARAIAARTYTAVEVAVAFSKRAIVAHQLTCCLTAWFMDDAVQAATALDEHLERTGATVGPLHGVPVSLKEHMPLRGQQSSAGVLSSLLTDQDDCQMVRILRSQGAVFYVKTNQPQLIMHLESCSFYGRTLNPFNIHLSAGGSTGGEAALIALRGSVLGVGTDIGGSIRGPAGFCGLYGYKPTSDTLPMHGFLPFTPASDLNIPASTGPLSRSLRDLDLFMRVVLGQKPYLEDPSLVPLAWSGLSSPAPAALKVGLVLHDGHITPQPPVRAALEWARSRLVQASNVTVEPFSMPEAALAVQLIKKAYWPEGYGAAVDVLHECGEPVFPLTQNVLSEVADQGTLDANAVADQRHTRDAFRYEFARHWSSHDVDIVLCPVFVGPASAHDTARHWNYTSFWNLVDYPGVTVPTPVRVDHQVRYQDQPVLSDADAEVRTFWDEGDFEAAPIGLQVVARRHHENELFAALHVLRGPLMLDSNAAGAGS